MCSLEIEIVEMAEPEEEVVIHLLILRHLHWEEMTGKTIIYYSSGCPSQQNHLHMVERGVPRSADFVFDFMENSKARAVDEALGGEVGFMCHLLGLWAYRVS